MKRRIKLYTKRENHATFRSVAGVMTHDDRSACESAAATTGGGSTEMRWASTECARVVPETFFRDP